MVKAEVVLFTSNSDPNLIPTLNFNSEELEVVVGGFVK